MYGRRFLREVPAALVFKVEGAATPSTSALQTARAWGYKEHAMTLWRYRTRGWARKAWQSWYRSAIRCRLEPVKRVARMIKRHLEGIVTAVVQGVSNARAESINAGVQWLKYSARGFRNRQRFRNAIYFHLGGLDLYPPVSAVTTSSTRNPEDPQFNYLQRAAAALAGRTGTVLTTAKPATTEQVA